MEAKEELARAKARLERAFSTTPDDRLNWSPAPTARTPIEQVVHSATAVGEIHTWLRGQPLSYATTAEADAHFRAQESEYRSREAALQLLDATTTAFAAWLDEVTEEEVFAIVELPFGMGSFRAGDGLDIPAMHTNHHAAQLEYMQTIYGDRDWHLGI